MKDGAYTNLLRLGAAPHPAFGHLLPAREEKEKAILSSSSPK